MGLRDIAAADQAAINADADGVAEDLEYAPTTGGVLELRGVFIDFGTLGAHPIGIGAERDRGEARARIAVADVARIDQKATITRVATAEEFIIVDVKLVAGIAWRVTLARRGPVRARGAR